MLIKLSGFWITTLDFAGWLLIQLALAWVFTRLPAHWFNPPPPRPWEDAGHFYDRLFAIRRWKDSLPDAARWFAGGFSKKTLIDKHTDYLARFIQETCRAELCHELAICCFPLFLLWNPWWCGLIMLAYAAAANLPCILVQRYNRLRLIRLLALQSRLTR